MRRLPCRRPETSLESRGCPAGRKTGSASSRDIRSRDTPPMRSLPVGVASAACCWQATRLRAIFSRPSSGLFSRDLRAANTITVQNLIIVHRHGDFDKPACKLERRLVMRNRGAAIPSNIQADPRDQVVKAKPRFDATCRRSVDQQRELAEPLARTHRRWWLLRETTDTDCEPVIPRRYRHIRPHDHVL